MAAMSSPHPTAADPSATVSSTVSSDGTTLAYRVLGDPAARPLVLVHGWSQSSACWGPELLAPLAERYRVVAVDLRGHGHSGVAGSGYDSAEQWADDLAAVLDAADVRDGAVLLGWSYGGIVVADYLASRGEDRVAGVVLCGAVTSVSRSAGGAIGPAMVEVTSGGAFDEDPATALKAFAGFGTAMMRGGSGTARQRVFGLSLATPPAVRQKLLTRRVDNDETLRALTVPALVLHGAHDGVIPPDTGRANAEMIPGARYVEFAESAHAPFLEEPSRFLAELGEFADGL
ncbi:MAG TPA: alpha/beta hydrolase [Candidatus Dietzia intestinipullorum]|nr:alpha/beta hydrolase [Candidatus Dietzia intestinipullorum]